MLPVFLHGQLHLNKKRIQFIDTDINPNGCRNALTQQLVYPLDCTLRHSIFINYLIYIYPLTKRLVTVPLVVTNLNKYIPLGKL